MGSHESAPPGCTRTVTGTCACTNMLDRRSCALQKGGCALHPQLWNMQGTNFMAPTLCGLQVCCGQAPVPGLQLAHAAKQCL